MKFGGKTYSQCETVVYSDKNHTNKNEIM